MGGLYAVYVFLWLRSPKNPGTVWFFSFPKEEKP